MTGDRPAAAPAFIASGAVVVPAELAEPLWLAMRDWIRERERDGARVRPGVQDLADTLRAATLARNLGTDMNGPTSGPGADIGRGSSVSAGFPTEAAAARLKVSVRHFRRAAAAEGINPIRRNCWAAEDVAALIARRRQ